MPDFDAFSVDDLKQVMTAFGLKTRNKKQMSAKIREMWASVAKQKEATRNADRRDADAQTSSSSVSTTASSSLIDPAIPPAIVPSGVSTLSPMMVDHIPPTASDPTRIPVGDSTRKRKVPPPPPATGARQDERDNDAASKPAAAPRAARIPASVITAATTSASGSDLASTSSCAVPPATAAAIRSFLRSQPDLFVRLLLFQPLDIVELAFLMQEVGGAHVHPNVMRAFLDAEGVCTSWNTGAANKRRGKR